MTAPAATLPLDVVPGPGVYDLDEAVYYGDPVPGGSLSSTGARALLSPSCPAKFAWRREHGETPRKVWDFGTVAHELVLGRGRGIVPLDFDSWRTNEVKKLAAEARAEGKVPILRKDYIIAEAMAAKLREHHMAAALLDPDYGHAERSLFWLDAETGVTCRGRLDWIDDSAAQGRLIIVDYKTCASADPDKIERSIADLGHHQQAAWYTGGVRALGIAAGARMALICQEKEPPYVVTVAEVAESAMIIGRERNRSALRIYAECSRTGIWPGYLPDTEAAYIGVPSYVEQRHITHMESS